MLAIDTNLIVRYLVNDDASQAAAARRLIDDNDVFVCTTVMLETEWVLRSVYSFSARQCIHAIRAFSGLPRVTLEDPASVAQALAWMEDGMDFADGLHLVKSDGCDAFVSFDREFVRAANRLDYIRVRTP